YKSIQALRSLLSVALSSCMEKLLHYSRFFPVLSAKNFILSLTRGTHYIPQTLSKNLPSVNFVMVIEGVFLDRVCDTMYVRKLCVKAGNSYLLKNVE
ncbi:MAG: hypothetical protein IJI45_14675, partial [Anaerolineaceae bacterium]|nr:hypothetical protein [Anaerolineaceae bacterium]